MGLWCIIELRMTTIFQGAASFWMLSKLWPYHFYKCNLNYIVRNSVANLFKESFFIKYVNNIYLYHQLLEIWYTYASFWLLKCFTSTAALQWLICEMLMLLFTCKENNFNSSQNAHICYLNYPYPYDIIIRFTICFLDKEKKFFFLTLVARHERRTPGRDSNHSRKSSIESPLRGFHCRTAVGAAAAQKCILRSPAFYICCICYLTCRTIVLFRWQHQKRIVKKKLIYKF